MNKPSTLPYSPISPLKEKGNNDKILMICALESVVLNVFCILFSKTYTLYFHDSHVHIDTIIINGAQSIGVDGKYCVTQRIS